MSERILNVGCGKTYIEGAFNIDINPAVRSDMVFDIGQHIPFYMKNESSLPNDYFDKIIAHDVLEHIPNLVTAMTNCRDLLKPGGIMDIIVPYDLSLGAWSDPTHVRAFNERSWIYYAEWAWYLGWKDWAFVCTKCELQCEGDVHPETPIDILSRTPRAISSMKVILQKVKYVAPQAV